MIWIILLGVILIGVAIFLAQPSGKEVDIDELIDELFPDEEDE